MQVFSQTDLVTDSERFYDSILELLDDLEEMEEVSQLLTWWNRYALYSTSFKLSSHPELDRSFPRMLTLSVHPLKTVH